MGIDLQRATEGSETALEVLEVVVADADVVPRDVVLRAEVD